jgi:kynurenine formamidase
MIPKIMNKPVHTVLFGAIILIVAHMGMLKKVPDKGFTFFAVLLKIKAYGSFAERAFAYVNSNIPDISQ